MSSTATFCKTSSFFDGNPSVAFSTGRPAKLLSENGMKNVNDVCCACCAPVSPLRSLASLSFALILKHSNAQDVFFDATHVLSAFVSPAPSMVFQQSASERYWMHGRLVAHWSSHAKVSVLSSAHRPPVLLLLLLLRPALEEAAEIAAVVETTWMRTCAKMATKDDRDSLAILQNGNTIALGDAAPPVATDRSTRQRAR